MIWGGGRRKEVGRNKNGKPIGMSKKRELQR